jgi:hypothetical protein
LKVLGVPRTFLSRKVLAGCRGETPASSPCKKRRCEFLYLHIGNQINIRERDIVGIFDTDRTTISWITRKYLSEAQKKELVSAACEEIPKSFVLYRDRRDGQYKIYFSQLSTAALCGRMNGRVGGDEN